MFETLTVTALEGWPILGAALGALALHWIVYLFLGPMIRREVDRFPGKVLRGLRLPTSIIVPVAVAQVVTPSSRLPVEAVELVRHFLALIQIAAISWALIRVLRIWTKDLVHRYRMDVKDNLQARKIHTQFRVLHRIILVTICVVGLSAMLMTFPKIRQLGTALLTSAGVAGLVVGMAARPALSNLIAGVQIALAQPIRLDDVVIVDGEWGRIEEINVTYVVIKIWDDRRLIVPLSYFNDHSFQNWTRTRADLIGSVFFHVDYTAPVAEIRAELKRILDASGLWDGEVWALHVTNSGDRSVELRALMSAPDSSTAWELRCLVRERLIEYLQRSHPECLPRFRGRIENLPDRPPNREEA